MENNALQKWKRKRTITTVLAMIHVGIYGLESSAIAISALYYFQTTLHVKNPTLFYSLAIGAMFTSASLSSVILGKYMDVNRNARLIVIGTVMLAVIGNFMYCLPYSPWLPVAGRLLCGFSDATMPVMTGEFTRCYKTSEINAVISIYQIIYAFSFTLGPCTPLLFQSVNIDWVIRIDQNVSIGIFLMLIQIIFVILSCFGLYNLSTEPGYELFLKEQEHDGSTTCEEEDYSDSNEENDENVTLLCKNDHNADATDSVTNDINLPLKEKKSYITFKELITDIDTLLVIFSSSLCGLLISLTELQMNILCLYELNWSLNRLSGTTLVAVLSSVTLEALLYKKLLKYPRILYYLYVACFIMFAIDMGLLMLLDATKFRNLNLQMVTVFIISCLNALGGSVGLTLGRLLMFTLVPSHSSSSCEGVRNSFGRIFCGVAYYLAAPTFPYLFTLYTFLLLVLGVLLCLFYSRRASFT